MADIVVKGMTCPHCVQSVTNALRHIPGLENVVVDLASGKASYSETHPVARQDIIDAIRRIGFDAE